MINRISNEHIDPSNNVICLVDIGYNATNIVIFSEGTYYINKNLNTGISTMLPSDNEKFDILGQQQQNHNYGMDTLKDYQGINLSLIHILLGKIEGNCRANKVLPCLLYTSRCV